MIVLRAGDAEALILPGQGAAFARLTDRGRDLLVPIPDGGDPNAGPHGAFLMAPWTNRLDGGRIVVAGVEHRMPMNRPADGTAIHGFLRDLPWRREAVGADSADLRCDFARAPFAGGARLAVRLRPGALELALELRNTAGAATPMGFGWHPWFPRPAGTRLSVAARTVFGRDARALPVAPRPSAGLNGGDAVLLGLDTHFAGWDGQAAITWPDGSRLAMQAEGAWMGNLQVYAPRGGTTLCVEPVSHAPDAPNRPAAAAHGAMRLLAPGEAMGGTLTLAWTP
jgi:aldose 1-epimerase